MIIYHSVHKVASMHISYVHHIHKLKAEDLFASKTQHASNNTQYPEQSKGFLQHILVFIQFLSSFHDLYSTIWNNNQDTIKAYFLFLKGRPLSEILYFL